MSVSSKQQAASSKQRAATRPSGPLTGPRATGVPKPEKNVSTLSRMVLGHQTISFGTRKAHDPEAQALHAPEWPCPRRAPPGAPSGPKTAQNHQKRAPVPPWRAPEAFVVQVNGQNQLRYCLGCLLAVFGPMWPRHAVCWAQNGFIWALNVSCGLKPKNGRTSG